VVCTSSAVYLIVLVVVVVARLPRNSVVRGVHFQPDIIGTITSLIGTSPTFAEFDLRHHVSDHVITLPLRPAISSPLTLRLSHIYGTSSATVHLQRGLQHRVITVHNNHCRQHGSSRLFDSSAHVIIKIDLHAAAAATAAVNATSAQAQCSCCHRISLTAVCLLALQPQTRRISLATVLTIQSCCTSELGSECCCPSVRLFVYSPIRLPIKLDNKKSLSVASSRNNNATTGDV